MVRPTTCPRCRRENDPGVASCPACGQRLDAVPAACAGCGTRLQPGFDFCGACGRAVGAARQTPREAARSPMGAAPPPGREPVPTHVRLASAVDGGGGELHALAWGDTLCGRSEGLIRLARDPAVSPRHARFVRDAHALRVEDLGSANGTFLRMRGPRALAPGDEVRVGRQLLRLEPIPPASAADAGAWGAPDGGCAMRLVQLLEGGGTGEAFPLASGESLVGRERGEITFPGDRYVSSRHARLDVSAGGVTITDLGSSNGTFVKVAAAELVAGDQLLLGVQLLRVEP